MEYTTEWRWLGQKIKYQNIFDHDFDIDITTIQVKKKNVYKPYPKSPTTYIIIEKRLNIWIGSFVSVAAAVFKVTIWPIADADTNFI